METEVKTQTEEKKSQYRLSGRQQKFNFFQKYGTYKFGLNTASAVDNRNYDEDGKYDDGEYRLNTASAVDNRNSFGHEIMALNLSQYRLSGRQQKFQRKNFLPVSILSQYRLSGRQQKCDELKVVDVVLYCLNTASAVDNRNTLSLNNLQFHLKT